jgi:hypothetical protein
MWTNRPNFYSYEKILYNQIHIHIRRSIGKAEYFTCLLNSFFRSLPPVQLHLIRHAPLRQSTTELTSVHCYSDMGSCQSSLTEDQWWPSDLGYPNASGAQNNCRYAYFAAARRLIIDDHGQRRVYDTGNHQIHGISQQQTSHRQSIALVTQHGEIALENLRLIDG